MKRLVVFAILAAAFLSLSEKLSAQNSYELRKITEDDWLAMTTDERLRAFGTGVKHAPNQTFMGDFGRYYDLYKTWGYDFYEMEDRYENYGFRGYENYNLINERRRRWSYNEFGDRLTKMTTSSTIFNETYYGDGRSSYSYGGGWFNAGTETDGVLVARESTSDWAVSIVSAGSLRKQFTPLTLSLPNMSGVAIDFQSANTQVSTINSGGPISRYEASGTSGTLRGGQIRRKFGVLTLGASYANRYVTSGNTERGDSWFGTLPPNVPVPIYAVMRILDDSPNDNEGGPIIYDMRLKINGIYRDDIQPLIFMDDVTRDKTTATTSASYRYYLEPQCAGGSYRGPGPGGHGSADHCERLLPGLQDGHHGLQGPSHEDVRQ